MVRVLKSTIRTIDARVVKPPVKKADPFYLTAEWRSMMAEIVKDRGKKCEEVGCGRSNIRVFGDHIIEIQDGGPLLDKRNIKLLCGSCHTKKTAASRAARMARRY